MVFLTIQSTAISPSHPVKERETMGSSETQTCSSGYLRPSDLHLETKLLIRRFRVRVPGGPPTNTR